MLISQHTAAVIASRSLIVFMVPEWFDRAQIRRQRACDFVEWRAGHTHKVSGNLELTVPLYPFTTEHERFGNRTAEDSRNAQFPVALGLQLMHGRNIANRTVCLRWDYARARLRLLTPATIEKPASSRP